MEIRNKIIKHIGNSKKLFNIKYKAKFSVVLFEFEIFTKYIIELVKNAFLGLIRRFKKLFYYFVLRKCIWLMMV